MQADKIAHLKQMKVAKNNSIAIQKNTENKRFEVKSKFSLHQEKPFVLAQQLQLEEPVAQEKTTKEKDNLQNLIDSKEVKNSNLQTENNMFLKNIESTQPFVSYQKILESIQTQDCKLVNNEDLFFQKVDMPLKENVAYQTNTFLDLDNLKIEENFEQLSVQKRNNSEHTNESTSKSEMRLLGKQLSNRKHKGLNNCNSIVGWSPYEMSPLRKRTPRRVCMPFSQEFKLEMSDSRFQYDLSNKKITEKEFNNFSQCLKRTSYGTTSSWVNQNDSNQNIYSMSRKREIGFYSSPHLDKMQTNYLESYYQQHKGLRGECRCLHCINHQLIPQPFSGTIPFERFNQPTLETPWSNLLVKVENYSFHTSSPDSNKSIYQRKQSPIKESLEQEQCIEHNIVVKTEYIESKITNDPELQSCKSKLTTQSREFLPINDQKSTSEFNDSNQEPKQPYPAFIVRKGKTFPSVIFIEGNKKFQCQICQKTFDSKQKLGGHKARSHPDAPCQRTEREKKRKCIDSLEDKENIKNKTKDIIQKKKQKNDFESQGQLNNPQQKNQDIFSDNMKYTPFLVPPVSKGIQKQKVQQHQKQIFLKQRNESCLIDEGKQNKISTSIAREEEQISDQKFVSENSKGAQQTFNDL